ncbi:unnamed protein product [Bursaphelenchus okinawaensis]|uniref:Mitochondrial import inner membrane translocase subunit Tim21 n=1 Tax=Bursaphelenchus okinawaensis TaxID=465554 RepID=A0A811KVF5_9BILA|nr:unnamed protein product [Bursaphelenchus okinawaensis]CAG9112890.1 unnamed protein product [Bursaphelenchus okinawaensis]
MGQNCWEIIGLVWSTNIMYIKPLFKASLPLTFSRLAVKRRMSVSMVRLQEDAKLQKAAKKQQKNELQQSVLEEIMFRQDEKPRTRAQKVKKGAENTFFYSALVVSIATLGGISYLLFEYFFAANSPQRIYSKSLDLIRHDPQCKAVIGSSITGFGEQSRRSRRHIANMAYEKDNEKRVRVTFHVKGDRGAGRAQVEMVQKPGESWGYRYLLVQMADRGDTLVLIDNR